MKTSQQVLRNARKQGWSDAEMASAGKVSEETVRRTRVDASKPPREMSYRAVTAIKRAVDSE